MQVSRWFSELFVVGKVRVRRGIEVTRDNQFKTFVVYCRGLLIVPLQFAMCHAPICHDPPVSHVETTL